MKYVITKFPKLNKKSRFSKSSRQVNNSPKHITLSPVVTEASGSIEVSGLPHVNVVHLWRISFLESLFRNHRLFYYDVKEGLVK